MFPPLIQGYQPALPPAVPKSALRQSDSFTSSQSAEANLRFAGFRMQDDRFQNRLHHSLSDRRGEIANYRIRNLSEGNLGLRIEEGLEGFADWVTSLSPSRGI